MKIARIVRKQQGSGFRHQGRSSKRVAQVCVPVHNTHSVDDKNSLDFLRSCMLA
jgi:hypothetical protein